MPKPGQCYEETYNMMMHNDILAREGRIIHGKVQDPKTGKWIDHAWIEYGTRVIDPTIIDGEISKSKYYETFNAKPEHAYTDLEATNQIFKQKKGFVKWQETDRKKKPMKTIIKRKICKCKK